MVISDTEKRQLLTFLLPGEEFPPRWEEGQRSSQLAPTELAITVPLLHRAQAIQIHRELSSLYPGGGNGNPLQCSCLENSMDRGVWQTTVHKVSESQTQLRD